MPVNFTLEFKDNIRCQNCGEKISENDLKDIIQKMKGKKDVPEEVRINAQRMLAEITYNSGKLSSLNGSDWVYLLQKTKEVVSKCSWSKLTGSNWKELLTTNPEYAEYCGISLVSDKTYWKKISPAHWTALSAIHSQFRPISDLVNGLNVSKHLQTTPDLIKYCSWDKISGNEWVALLKLDPKFIAFCTWDSFSGKDWVEILLSKPEYASYCNWEKLSETDFNAIQKVSGEIRKHINLSSLPPTSFYRIVEKMKWGKDCDWSRITSGSEWCNILRSYPGLSPFCNWSLLKPKDWVSLLSQQPSLHSKCTWNTFSHEDWNLLLSVHPEFIKHYPITPQNVWNYQDHYYSFRPALCLHMSRIFVFAWALLFLVLFSFVSLWGASGWFCLFFESKSHALLSVAVWGVIALIWSFVYSKNWAGEYSRWIQILSTFFFSLVVFVIYFWTFFFSRVSFGIVFWSLFVIVLLFVPCFTWFKFKRLVLFLSPLLLVVVYCSLLPYTPMHYYKIGESLYVSKFPFVRASRSFYEKGCSTDPVFSDLEKQLNNSISAKDWRGAEKRLNDILDIIPFYSKKENIEKTIKDLHSEEDFLIADSIRKNTVEAKKSFRSKKYSNAFSFAQQADQEDVDIILMLAWMYEHGKGTKANISLAQQKYLEAAKTGSGYAQYQYALFLDNQNVTINKTAELSPSTWLKRAAQNNYPPACVRLSEALCSGKYGEIDIDKAIQLVLPFVETNYLAARQLARIYVLQKSDQEALKYYEQMIVQLLESAQKDDKEALFYLGEAFETGEGCDMSPEIAFDYYEQSHLLDYRPATLKVAQALEGGNGTQKNHKKAIDLLNSLAEDGMSDAMYSLGHSYLQEGTRDSDSLGLEWLFKAADNNNLSAQAELAHLLYFGDKTIKDYASSFKYARMAADRGDSSSQFLMGNFYMFGHGVVDTNAKEAFKWYMKAAEQGHVDAQYNVGHMYEIGDADKLSFIEAANWFKKAATAGHVQAQYRLGLFYQKGNGVPQNDNEAIKWYQLAAKQGHVQAKERLNTDYKSITANKEQKAATDKKTTEKATEKSKSSASSTKNASSSKSESDEVKRFREMAERGDPRAQFNLAYCYEMGDGVKKDMEKALYWYRKAADSGSDLAVFRLQSLENRNK